MDEKQTWVTNINHDANKDSAVQSILRKKYKPGPPKEVPNNFGGITSVEELEEMKIIGLYREI
jgi:hypothetical protein|tara:strand:+ start:110 stop:298 length:189 start_codon:yes stop_codon:yes gene_type:complete